MLDVRTSRSAPAIAWDRISLAHGAGGRAAQQLLDTVFRPAFAARTLDLTHDGAVVDAAGARLAFTTDSYVVRPLFFPGGTLGDLAVNGTVNNLAMCGARPLWLSAAFVLEEGLPMGDLRAIVTAMRDAARDAGVAIVTGDTKVVERRGTGDGIFITTTGVGIVEHTAAAPERVRPGDAVIVSGDLGAHGMAIVSARNDLRFAVKSDTAPLWPAIEALFAASVDVRCMRDLTRGGLASALNKIAGTAGVSIVVDDEAIVTRPVVRAACELLGLDPLYLANGGRFVAFVPPDHASRALEALRGVDVSRGAALVGFVQDAQRGFVTLRSRDGQSHVLDVLTGEQLPRIC